MNIRNSYCPQLGYYQFKQVYVKIFTVMNTNIYACSAHKNQHLLMFKCKLATTELYSCGSLAILKQSNLILK